MKKVSHKIALWISLLLAIATIPAITSAASALPENVEIRLITPYFDDTNNWRDAERDDEWMHKSPPWFADEGFTFRQGWAPVGSTIYFTYLVTNGDTHEPLANTSVKLRVNKGYSGSNAMVTVNGLGPTTGADNSGSPLDQLQVTATTDAFGFVTFTMVNVDTPDVCGEPKPDSWTQQGGTIFEIDDCNVAHYTQIFPEVLGQLIDHADMTEIHFYKEPNAPEYDLSTTTARVATPVFDETNSIQRNDLEEEFTITHDWYAEGLHFFQKYAPASRKINLTYHVTDANGDAVIGQEVSLSVGKANSRSNAKLTDGITATDLAAAADADQAIWTGTTDAFGNVYFAARSTDLTGQTKPATWTDTFLTADTGAKFTQIFPSIAGAGSLIGDMVEFHFYTDPTAAKTAITVTGIKGKIKVVVANPHGKAVKITIDGKKVTKNPAEDKTSVTYFFKKAKGKHKVIVVCNSVRKSVTRTVK